MTDTTPTVVETTAPDENLELNRKIDQEDAESSPAVVDSDESSKPKGVQLRINELTRLRHDAERDRDHWRELAMRSPTPVTQEAKADEPAKEPTLEDHNYDESAYRKALAKHIKDEALKEIRADFQREQAQKTESERRDAFLKRQDEFIAKTPDYKDLVYTAPINDVMRDIIVESERGPEIAYYLGTNLEEAKRIVQMSERQAAVALGKIEAKLESSVSKETPVPVKKVEVSKAPPPPPKIDAVEPAVDKDPATMSDAEFAKWRRRQIAQRR